MGRTVFKTELKSELVTYKSSSVRGVFFEEQEEPYKTCYTEDYTTLTKDLRSLKPGDKIVIQYYLLNKKQYIIDFIKI